MVTYAAKVTRIVRVIRLIRIFRLYRVANQDVETQATKKLIEDIVKESNVSEDLAKQIQRSIKQNKVVEKQMNTLDLVINDDKKESYVGKTLNDSTTRKIIILSLALIFSFPIFAERSYITEPDSFNCGVDLLLRLRDSQMAMDQKKALFDKIIEMQTELASPLIYLKIAYSGSAPLVWQSADHNFVEMRYDEVAVVRP